MSQQVQTVEIACIFKNNAGWIRVTVLFLEHGGAAGRLLPVFNSA